MAGPRLAYRIAEVCELAGVSRAAVEGAVRRGEIRAKLVGRVKLLDPNDVSNIFGFNAAPEVVPSAESVAEMESLLA